MRRIFNEKLDLRQPIWRLKRMTTEDKRLTKRLMDYWNRLRRDLPLPQWEKFTPESLADVWGQCCVWRVEVATMGKQGNQFIYEYVGSNAKEAIGKDLTGIMFQSHLQNFQAAKITNKIEEVVTNALPIGDEGSFVNAMNKVVKYRSCLLPFGSVDGKVTRIVLGLSWKTFG